MLCLWHPIIAVVVDYSTSSYYTTPVLGLFGCSLYKSVPLQGVPWNASYPLMKPWDMFFWDRPATTCPMGEDCPAIFYWDAILIPHVTRLLWRALPILVALKRGRPRMSSKGTGLQRPALWQKIVTHFFRWGPRGHFATRHSDVARLPLANLDGLTGWMDA